MCHVLQDPAFFHFLTRIDEEFAAVTRLGRPDVRVRCTLRITRESAYYAHREHGFHAIVNAV